MSAARDWAEAAVTYTRSKLGAFPDNHLLRKINPLDDGWLCVNGNRAAVGGTSGYENDKIKWINNTAVLAEAGACGYCGEYSAVSFMYLVKNNCLLPIEYAGYDGGDHAFVIINRPSNTELKAPRTWGRDCYVADAWSGDVVAVDDYWDDMIGTVYAPYVSYPYVISNMASAYIQ